MTNFERLANTSTTIGRLAPSPTGAQHIGNARTFLIAWLLCRQQANNRLILRIEDLETPRTKAWAIAQAYEDLAWLGLDWDASPNEFANSSVPLLQSERHLRYREIIDELLRRELVYPCTCTRSEVAMQAAAAPHESTFDGQVYPGTCRHLGSRDCAPLRSRNEPYCLRFRWDCEAAAWADRFFGPHSINPVEKLGDFVVWRMDDAPAYQLAVVIDDHDSSVNQIVRGADLIYSTFRQNAIYDALNWNRPQYTHVPLVVGLDGRRLAKRHGDTRLASLRQEGISAGQLVGYLAWKSRWIESPRAIDCRALLSLDLLALLPTDSLVLDSATAFLEMRELL